MAINFLSEINFEAALKDMLADQEAIQFIINRMKLVDKANTDTGDELAALLQLKFPGLFKSAANNTKYYSRATSAKINKTFGDGYFINVLTDFKYSDYLGRVSCIARDKYRSFNGIYLAIDPNFKKFVIADAEWLQMFLEHNSHYISKDSKGSEYIKGIDLETLARQDLTGHLFYFEF